MQEERWRAIPPTALLVWTTGTLAAAQVARYMLGDPYSGSELLKIFLLRGSVNKGNLAGPGSSSPDPWW